MTAQGLGHKPWGHKPNPKEWERFLSFALSCCLSKMEKSKSIRVRMNQMEILVQAMEANPYLNGSKLSQSYSASQRQTDWEELTKKLNCSGGAVKTTLNWRRCWSDKKSEVKKRYNAFKNGINKTGGGKNTERPLSALEERILVLVGTDAFEGVIPIEAEDVNEATVNSEVSVPEDRTLDMESGEPVPASSPPPTPQAETPKADARLLSILKRARAKPLVLKGENTQKLLDGQSQTSSALKRCAEALEKSNALQEEMLIIKRKRLEVEQQKADAFSGLLSFLQNKLQ